MHRVPPPPPEHSVYRLLILSAPFHAYIFRAAIARVPFVHRNTRRIRIIARLPRERVVVRLLQRCLRKRHDLFFPLASPFCLSRSVLLSFVCSRSDTTAVFPAIYTHIYTEHRITNSQITNFVCQFCASVTIYPGCKLLRSVATALPEGPSTALGNETSLCYLNIVPSLIYKRNGFEEPLLLASQLQHLFTIECDLSMIWLTLFSIN